MRGNSVCLSWCHKMHWCLILYYSGEKPNKQTELNWTCCEIRDVREFLLKSPFRLNWGSVLVSVLNPMIYVRLCNILQVFSESILEKKGKYIFFPENDGAIGFWSWTDFKEEILVLRLVQTCFWRIFIITVAKIQQDMMMRLDRYYVETGPL